MKNDVRQKGLFKSIAVIFLIFALVFAFVACTTELPDDPDSGADTTINMDSNQTDPDSTDDGAGDDEQSTQDTNSSQEPVRETPEQFISNSQSNFDYSKVPEYDGNLPYYVVNGNNPYFADASKQTVSFEIYGARDSLGRCGVVIANVGKDIMPTEDRGSIGSVKPTGWHTVKYDCVDGKYLYNRCHLIGYQLTGENANEDNLITGTRYLNVKGMLPFENMVADYVTETGNHVMYRVTPIFVGNELLARGVLMEAYSVEDNGDGICFNVFCYNVQPQIDIDYTTGESKLIEDKSEETQPPVHVHDWEPATCTSPKKCSTCGETQGNALNHSYNNGTCTACGQKDPNYSIEQTVYTTKTGKRYHSRSSCSGLNNANAIYESTLTAAKNKGLTPCEKCH